MNKLYAVLPVFLILFLSCATVQNTKQPTGAADAAPADKKVSLLFVQSARSASLDGNKLVLNGINPVTLFFSDRPERITGHIATAKAMPRWSAGQDSFAADPPNATLSILHENSVQDVILVLRNPSLKGDTLTYDVKILRGEKTAGGGPCSLFIDTIGRPLTPMSYDGAARRYVRRGEDGTVVYVDDDSDSDDDDDDD